MLGNGWLQNNDGMLRSVGSKASHIGLTGTQQGNYLMKKRKFSRTPARYISLAYPGIRATALLCGFVAMESFFRYDYKFTKNVSKRMSVKVEIGLDHENRNR